MNRDCRRSETIRVGLSEQSFFKTPATRVPGNVAAFQFVSTAMAGLSAAIHEPLRSALQTCLD
jgi:hypothetical protein